MDEMKTFLSLFLFFEITRFWTEKPPNFFFFIKKKSVARIGCLVEALKKAFKSNFSLWTKMLG